MTTTAPSSSSRHPARPPSEVLIRCDGAARTFGAGASAVVAVHGATCQVVAGDRIVLTGASGSGKSTLLHLLAGLDQPTTGTVRHHLDQDDQDEQADAGRDRIGIVFQGPSLLPTLDAAENVALPLLFAGRTERAAATAAEQALDLVGVADLRHRLPSELSDGQAQRVAIARAVAIRPPLLLADEPTGHLDRHTADHVVSVLLAAADDTGAALVIATHDESVAARLGTRWRMRDGRLTTHDRDHR
jgi:putative ABC transport system ATP-binding protein